jgi:CRISPR/Cas system-associated protein Cas10 (large subunit of type III CRISPR-Cas system)
MSSIHGSNDLAPNPDKPRQTPGRRSVKKSEEALRRVKRVANVLEYQGIRFRNIMFNLEENAFHKKYTDAELQREADKVKAELYDTIRQAELRLKNAADRILADSTDHGEKVSAEPQETAPKSAAVPVADK